MYVYVYMYVCVYTFVCMYVCMVCMYIPHLLFEPAGRDRRYRRYDDGRSRHAEHYHLEMWLTYDDTDCERLLLCEVV
jgi:hypothetical protein